MNSNSRNNNIKSNKNSHNSVHWNDGDSTNSKKSNDLNKRIKRYAFNKYYWVSDVHRVWVVQKAKSIMFTISTNEEIKWNIKTDSKKKIMFQFNEFIVIVFVVNNNLRFFFQMRLSGVNRKISLYFANIAFFCSLPLKLSSPE